MKKIWFYWLLYILAYSLPVFCYWAWNRALDLWFLGNSGSRPDYIPWEVIVKYKTDSDNIKNSSSLKILWQDLSAKNLEIKDTIPDLNIATISIKDDKSVEEIVDELKKTDNFEYVQPNYYYYEMWINTNDPYREDLWWLQNDWNGISWAKMWDTFSGSILSNTTWNIVAVVDAWVNYNHEDLSSQMWEWNTYHWYDFVNNDANPMPAAVDAHWTHVAWTIAAAVNNWKWIVWVNPKAKIMSLKALENGWWTSTTVANAIITAANSWAKIINASLWWNNPDTSLLNAISYLKSKWWILVAAAWNEWKNNEYYSTYPCNYDLDNIICVAATTEEWKLASFSNYWKTSVDIWAPWTNIYSTSVDEFYNSPHNVDFTEISISDLNEWWNISWSYMPLWTLMLFSNGTYIQPKSPINVTNTDDLWIKATVSCGATAWISLDVNTWSWLKNIANYDINSSYINIWKVYNGELDYRLSLHTNGGWYCSLYDISIQTLNDYTWPSIYEYMQWTSMATPHVAWLASLAWSFRPDLTYTGVIKAIMDNWDSLDSLQTWTVSWKRINAYNTLYALDNYAPIAPTLIIPENWNTISDFPTDVEFKWNPATDTGVWISWYVFELSNNIDFSSLITWITLNTTWLNFNISSTWNYFWRVKAFDIKGNTWDYSEIRSFSVRKVSSCSISPDITDWTNWDIILTATINWDVDKYSWTWFDDLTNTLTTYIVWNNWTKTFYFKDVSWFTGSCSIEINNIDKASPNVSLSNGSSSRKTSPISITLNSEDEGSWLSWDSKYLWSDSPSIDLNQCWIGGTNFNNNESITDSVEWTRYLYVCAYDKAGNSDFASGIYKLDTWIPMLTINYSTTDSCTDSDVTVTVNAIDEVSWIPDDWYSWDNKQTRWASTWLTLSDNSAGIVYVKDNAWNTTWIEYNVFWMNSDSLVVTANNAVWWECTVLTWSVSVNNKSCGNGDIYYLWEDFWIGTTNWEFSYKLMWPWIRTWLVTVTDSLLNETGQVSIIYTWTDSQPTLTSGNYIYDTQIKSTDKVEIGNVVVLLGASDWACWNSTEFINATNVSCTNGTFVLNNNELSIIAPSNSEWFSTCIITFTDDENNSTTWSFIYTYNTKTSWNNSWWWGGGWGGWGWWWWGWGGWSKKTDDKIDDKIDHLKDLIYWDDDDNNGDVIDKIDYLKDLVGENDDINDENNSVNYPVNTIYQINVNNGHWSAYSSNWFLEWSSQEVLANGYTRELNNAYSFAYINWITTMNSIKNANMNWRLKRIEMAKMLSNYAIRTLWKIPDTSKSIAFWDVSSSLDAQYGNWVTLAYQLWIMWQNMKNNNFRPDDIVTRAEFATALSRLLYWTKDWSDSYYSTHLEKLYLEWIISNTNPNMHEVRWYVMLMLMRSSIK